MRNIRIGQAFPTDTNATLIYTTPDNGTQPKVTLINVAKVITAAANFSIYFNPGGTYNETTALYYQIIADAKRKTILIEFVKGLGMGNKGDTLYVQSHTASAFNFNVFAEVDK